MILSFIEYFDTKKQKPTYFREKIWAGPGKSSFDCNGTRMICDLKAANAESEFRTGSPIVKLLKPKLHTIREDSHDQWEPGMTIQMVYRGAGYKIKDEFNKGIQELSKCVSVQKIRFEWHRRPYSINRCKVYIDDVIQNTEQVEILAINDGFDSIHDFFAWFEKNFTGKIIHWTDLRY